jgi:hypothetical protein
MHEIGFLEAVLLDNKLLSLSLSLSLSLMLKSYNPTNFPPSLMM